MPHPTQPEKPALPLPTPSASPNSTDYFPSMVIWFLTEVVVAEIDPSTVTLDHCRAIVKWEFEGRDTAELAIALLPDRVPGDQFYTLKDMADVAGNILPSHISRHALELWPKRGRTCGVGNYRLSIQDATSFLRRYYFLGKKCFKRSDLELRVAKLVLIQIQRRHRVRPPLCDLVAASSPL